MRIPGFILLFVLASCSSGSGDFCECLEVSDELQQYSNALFEKEKIGDTEVNKMDELKAAKKKACAEYETMGGEEMLELKKNCKSATSNPEASENP